MGIVELVLETADADRQLLDADREQGDRAEVPRDIDFVLRAATEDRARLVCDLVTDLGYGRADRSDLGEDGGSRPWRVVVTIMAPATAEIACSLSGLMACLSKLYDLDYDGWGCVLVRGDERPSGI